MLEVLALLARVEAGRQVVARRPCDLAETLAPAVRELAAIAAERGIPLRLGKLRGTVLSEPKLLLAAGRSLFLNALRFHGGGPVRVGCRHGPGHLSLEVEFGRSEVAAGIGTHAFIQLQPGADRTGAGEVALGLALLCCLCRPLRHELHCIDKKSDRQLLVLMLPVPGL
jgi:hypothetical protein